jgi:hypothetical protein
MDMGLSDSRAQSATDCAPGLRPLGWSELCARLVAAQDLRRDQAGLARLAGRTQGALSGSFHDSAASMLERAGTAHVSPEPGGGAQGFVNSTSSTSGKGNQFTTDLASEISLIPRQIRQADENSHD